MKGFRLEFVGGFWPGASVDSRSRISDEVDLAHGYYLLYQQGTLEGLVQRLSVRAIKTLQDRGWTSQQLHLAGIGCDHAYVLVERIETDCELLLRFQFGPFECSNRSDFVG